jgi:hypothetical protein
MEEIVAKILCFESIQHKEMVNNDFERQVTKLEKDTPFGWTIIKQNDFKNFKHKKYVEEHPGPGLYIIKVNNAINHFIGTSKIIYIGSSKNLIQRLNALLGNNKNVHTAKKSLERIRKETQLELEVLFVNYNSDGDYTNLESTLIEEFMLIHIEKPPVNCNRK